MRRAPPRLTLSVQPVMLALGLRKLTCSDAAIRGPPDARRCAWMLDGVGGGMGRREFESVNPTKLYTKANLRKARALNGHQCSHVGKWITNRGLFRRPGYMAEVFFCGSIRRWFGPVR